MIHAKVAPLDPGDSRLAARRLVNFGARLRAGSSGDSQDVVVVDLSAEGCKLLLCGSGVAEGIALWIKLPGQEARRMHVVWVRDGEAGCEFAEPLGEAEKDACRKPLLPLAQRRRTSFGLRR